MEKQKFFIKEKNIIFILLACPRIFSSPLPGIWQNLSRPCHHRAMHLLLSLGCLSIFRIWFSWNVVYDSDKSKNFLFPHFCNASIMVGFFILKIIIKTNNSFKMTCMFEWNIHKLFHFVFQMPNLVGWRRWIPSEYTIKKRSYFKNRLQVILWILRNFMRI